MKENYDFKYSRSFIIAKEDDLKILKCGAPRECFICNAPTFWVENEHMKPICSDRCLEQLWEVCPKKILCKD